MVPAYARAYPKTPKSITCHWPLDCFIIPYISLSRLTFLHEIHLFPMPAYCLQDCHYFFRTALRGLSVATQVSPLYC